VGLFFSHAKHLGKRGGLEDLDRTKKGDGLGIREKFAKNNKTDSESGQK